MGERREHDGQEGIFFVTPVEAGGKYLLEQHEVGLRRYDERHILRLM